MQSRKVTQARWQAQKTVFTQTRHKAVFVQASKHSLDVAKMGGESLDSDCPLSEWKSKTARSEVLCRKDPRETALGQAGTGTSLGDRDCWEGTKEGGPGGGMEIANSVFTRTSFIWQLSIPEEMSGRLPEISVPAQGDGWFTLWPASISHQSSHRKIMPPSSEFMQTVVHLSEDKKMHFHFKMKTLKVLSKAQTRVSICLWTVSTHACCAISVGVYTTRPATWAHWSMVMPR